jgi:hypothetical protein
MDARIRFRQALEEPAHVDTGSNSSFTQAYLFFGQIVVNLKHG